MLSLGSNQYLLNTDDPAIRITLRFSADGARLGKMVNSVRGVVKLVPPRNQLRRITTSPKDEVTMFFPQR